MIVLVERGCWCCSREKVVNAGRSFGVGGPASLTLTRAKLAENDDRAQERRGRQNILRYYLVSDSGRR